MLSGKKTLSVLLMSLLILFSFSGCNNSSVSETSSLSSESQQSENSTGNLEQTKIRYVLWDQNQAKTYKTVIDKFMNEESGITVEMEQVPYADYFTKLATERAGGSGPDLITMMISQFKTLESKGSLEPINSYIDADSLDMTKYNSGAVDMFTVNGNIYGLPKDFDSMGLFYNKDLLKEAGYEEFPADLQWDSETGGTFVEFLQKLTKDKNGKHPNEEGFNPDEIVQYGFLPVDRAGYALDGIISTLISQNGADFIDRDTSALKLDDEKNLEALGFVYDMQNKWYVTPPLSLIQSTGAEALFYTQTCALFHNGPWMSLAIQENASFEWGIAQNSKGPNGKSMSRVNSLVDCIYSGSKNKDAAWKLLKYIATTPGQDILGETGTVIPAYKDSTQKYVDFYADNGIDVSAFIDAYFADPVFPPSAIEFPRASDSFDREFSLALADEKTMEEAMKNVTGELNPILTEANK